MTTIRTTPNVEAAVAAVLRTDLGIDASSGLKKDPTFPCITVQRIGGSHIRKRALDSAEIQIDAWGRTKAEAFNAIADARTSVLSMEGEAYDTSNQWPVDIQIAEVIEAVGIQWLPDDQTNTDRYVFQVTIVSHTV